MYRQNIFTVLLYIEIKIGAVGCPIVTKPDASKHDGCGFDSNLGERIVLLSVLSLWREKAWALCWISLRNMWYFEFGWKAKIRVSWHYILSACPTVREKYEAKNDVAHLEYMLSYCHHIFRLTFHYLSKKNIYLQFDWSTECSKLIGVLTTTFRDTYNINKL